MKKNILIILIVALFAYSCEWREFGLSPELTESGTYILDDQGSFNETKTFSLIGVFDELDLPETALISEIYIQSLSITGVTLTGNEANGINIQGTVTYDNETVNLFTVNNIAIVNNGIQEIALNNLNPVAMELLKNFMKAKIFSFYGFPWSDDFELTDNFITINVFGTVNPSASSRINLQCEFNINLAITYTYCMETLPFAGDECDR